MVTRCLKEPYCWSQNRLCTHQTTTFGMCLKRKMHLYTALQFLQLGVLCGFGFAPLPYLKMVFPVLLMFILPIRHLLVPKLISSEYLEALDAHL
ncbi:solute carrier family 4 member 11-like [Pocillopora verrucosa]|uniref:solute carrier family 4 member 11-like n=1 Tax=Pocillopora verrucosa TaxID=203993 RepID=UPI00333F181E